MKKVLEAYLFKGYDATDFHWFFMKYYYSATSYCFPETKDIQEMLIEIDYTKHK